MIVKCTLYRPGENYENMLREFFNFNRQDRRAIIILVGLNILGLIIWKLIPLSPSKQIRPLTTLEQTKLSELIGEVKSEELKKTNQVFDTSLLKHFDPNKLTIEEALDLGFPKKLAKTLCNFTGKGGGFYKKEDLKKIYGLEDGDYFLLEPFVQIEKKEFNSNKNGTKKHQFKNNHQESKEHFQSNKFQEKSKTNQGDKKPIQKIELSDFDPNSLTKQKAMALGINSKAAYNIEKYLNKGGSFKTKADLKKIYSLTESEFEQLETYIQLPNTREEFSFHEKNNTEQQEHKQPEKFAFNPNQLNHEIAEQLGLDKKVTNNILKFIESGGTFESKEDLKVIYSINDSIYQSLEAYIELPSKPKPQIQIFEINSASVADLKSLNGIGDYFAKAIIKYRNQLGGFINLEQLKEVYNMDQEKLDKIAPFLICEGQPKQKIKINSGGIEELKLHPYLNYNAAKHITKLRKHRKPFTKPEDVFSPPIIDSVLFRRIKPYISLE